jgi:hypothetical protein
VTWETAKPSLPGFLRRKVCDWRRSLFLAGCCNQVVPPQWERPEWRAFSDCGKSYSRLVAAAS